MDIWLKYQFPSMITAKLCWLKEKLGFEALTAQLIPFLAKKENQENNFLRRADKSNVNVLDNSLQSLGGGRLDLAHKYSFLWKDLFTTSQQL